MAYIIIWLYFSRSVFAKIFFVKVSICDQNFDFCPRFRFLVKILIFCQNFYCLSKFQFLVKFSIFSHNFNFRSKFRFLAKISIFGVIGKKIWQLGPKKPAFIAYLRYFSCSVSFLFPFFLPLHSAILKPKKICYCNYLLNFKQNFDFWSKFRFFCQNFDFWSKFRFFCQNFDFWSEFGFYVKISILCQNFDFMSKF